MQINDLGLYNIVIDFNKMTTYTANNRIIYKENDINTSKIKAKLIKDDENIDLTDVKVEIRTLTSTQETSLHEVNIVDKENGIIEYTFPINALCEGINFFELILTKGDMIKTSPRIAYEVLDSIEDLSLEKEVNYPILIQLIKDVKTLKESTNEFLETVKVSESVRIKNEETRVKQENDRQVSIKSMENTFNNKIKEVDDTKNKLVQDVDNKINEVNTSKINMETKVSNKINELDSKFKELQKQDVVSEVDKARGKYPSLPSRLDNLDKDLLNVKDTAIIPVTTEKNFETVEETVNGYLTNFKIEGKTVVVNSENQEVEPGTEGATLKSVGDDVEEIVVSSVNKNLVDKYNYSIKTESVLGFDISNLSYGKEYTFLCDNALEMKISTDLYSYTSNSIVGNKGVFTLSRNVNISSSEKQFIFVRLENGWVKCTDLNNLKLMVCAGNKMNELKYLEHKQDKKKVLYYDTETQSWKKPVLMKWDSIEEHSNSKYYYHQRSGKRAYQDNDETNQEVVTDKTNTIYKLNKEKVFECTPIDLISYENKTKYIIECGSITPESSFKYEGNIGNVINTLKEKVSYLEDKLYKTNLANFTVALNTLDTKLRLDKLETPK